MPTDPADDGDANGTPEQAGDAGPPSVPRRRRPVLTAFAWGVTLLGVAGVAVTYGAQTLADNWPPNSGATSMSADLALLGTLLVLLFGGPASAVICLTGAVLAALGRRWVALVLAIAGAAAAGVHVLQLHGLVG